MMVDIQSLSPPVSFEYEKVGHSTNIKMVKRVSGQSVLQHLNVS
jgi:hypothetical protein